MKLARQKVYDAVAASKQLAVMSSFGKDSMLLLALVRELTTDFTTIWLRTGQPEAFAKRIILDWDLTAYSWHPADVYMLSPTTMIHEYAFGTDRWPMVLDLAPGTTCSLNRFPNRTPQLFMPFDLILWGAKDSDHHAVKGNTPLKGDGFMAGHAKVVAPLRHMSDDAVRAALLELKIPYKQVDDELPLCTQCMQPGEGEVYCPELHRYIPRHQWESDLSLTAFRARFLEDTNGKGI